MMDLVLFIEIRNIEPKLLQNVLWPVFCRDNSGVVSLALLQAKII